MTGRQTLRIVTAGHVDHGKSTVIGRLLAEGGGVPDGKLEQVKAYCQRHSRPFEYAFLLDALKDEQSQGITIDAARIFFKTAERDYILIDAPGHIEFLKNMVTGAAHASAALLVIDAQEGLRENSRRHGYLLSMLGLRQICVLINKMDLVDYREAEFMRLRDDCAVFLGRLGIVAECFIPVSGFHGDNIAARSSRMGWYSGPTLLEAIEGLRPEEPAVDKPFRMFVQDVYKFTKFGDDRRIVAGTVESGSIAGGDEVVFYPSGKRSAIASIASFPESRQTRACAGMATGLTLSEQIYVRRGELAVLRSEPPPAVTTRLRANLFWLGRAPLSMDKEYALKLGSARVHARVEAVERVLDASTLEARTGEHEVSRHQAAQCVLALENTLAFDPAAQHPTTSRFALLDDYEISGGGIILEALADKVQGMREKVALRNSKWQRSDIPADKRQERYGNKPGLVLITGPRDSQRKEVARALESSLFDQGRLVYFLAIGSVLYGIDADIRGAAENHPEDIRRLAELAHIMLDAGVILIVSAAELRQEDLDIISVAVEPERIETVWVGGGQPDSRHSLVIGAGDISASVEAVSKRLAERGWIGQ